MPGRAALRLLAATLGVTAVMVLAVPSTAGTAAGLLHVPGQTVWPGLLRHRLEFTHADGNPVVGDVLSWRLDDASLRLRPVLSNATIPGLETVPAMGRRLLNEGHVAGVNAGFWLSFPLGDPNGYFAVDGVLVSDAETQGAGPRGTFGITADGRMIMDRLATAIGLFLPDGSARIVDGVNRGPRFEGQFDDGPDQLFAYTAPFDDVVAVPDRGETDIRTIVVDALTLPSFGATAGVVTDVVDGNDFFQDIPANGVVFVARGAEAQALAGVRTGDTLQVFVDAHPVGPTSRDDWLQVKTGVAAGPLIVRDGAVVDPAGWEDEGFAPQVHSNVRAPRSGIGLTPDGRVLLATVDGRQPEYSTGMTIREFAEHMIGLGAAQALSLDGGGSTQIAVDGVLRNQPCCDQSLRPVATGLFIDHDYTFQAAARLGGRTREETAASVARATHPDGATQVLLAPRDRFPDALAGGPLAVAVDGPLLLTGPDALPEATAEALTVLQPESITILGGTGVISQALADELSGTYDVRRLSGPDRVETAAAIARDLGLLHPRAFLAAAGGFADALSAAAPAGIFGAPILLSAGAALSPATRELFLDSLTREVVVVGGTDALSEAVAGELVSMGIAVTRLAGSSRYGTNRAVNEFAEQQIPALDRSGVYVARGDVFPDALAGGPAAAAAGQLLVLVPGGSIASDPDSGAYLSQRQAALTQATLLGGYAALSSYQQYELDRLAVD